MYHQRRHKSRFNDKLPPQLHDDLVEDLFSSIPDLGFKSDYLKKELLSKFLDPELVSPSDRRDAGIRKWLAAEQRNRKTNQRLMFAYDVDFGWTTYDALLSTIRSFISDVLGPLNYPDILFGAKFTNGATTRIRRGPTASVLKLGGDIELSDSCVKHWLQYGSQTILSSQNLRLRDSSVLFTVPKKTDIDRVACKEPDGNALLQRAVGQTLARKLKRFGLDLSDQTRNQRLARKASLIGSNLATIDLSSASDTISRQLVFELLPFEWYSLLDDLRMKTCSVDGNILDLEMFSSMGNGFTFELETLIFWCITRAVCYLSRVAGTISVYGDDIIAPSKIVPRLSRVFSFLGFEMNMKKTNWRGHFRESCGAHYYRGLDVSPFYIRERVRTRSALINLLNQVLNWSGRGWGFFLDKEIASFHLKYSSYIPQDLWGGVDTSDPYALVTGHMPRKRLSPVTRDMTFSPELGLRSWLHTKESSDACLSIKPSMPVALKTQSNRILGAVTSWRPYLVYPGE